jgi:hypothetical protein
MFARLVDTHGAIELDRVHRFTQPWERAASLQLRHGDVEALDLYEQQGRLHGGSTALMERQLVVAWRTARADGSSVAVMAATRASVDRLNERLQRERIRAGELDPLGPRLTVREHTVLLGDTVVTRHNDRTLWTDRHEPVRNRDTWTVAALSDDGSMTLTGSSGRVRLPADYVAEHVELGYATTAHASQGRTVDHALTLLDGPADAAAVYVPMTRGRCSNHLFVVTSGEESATEVVATALHQRWADQPAHTHRASAFAPNISATEPLLGGEELRYLYEEAVRLGQERARRIETRAGAQHALTECQDCLVDVRRQLADVTATLDRRVEELGALELRWPRRRRRHEIDQLRRDVKRLDHRRAELDRRQCPLQRELSQREAAAGNLRADTQNERALQNQLDRLHARLAADAARCGQIATHCPATYHLAVLGPVPVDLFEQLDWQERAGRIDQYRTAYQIHDPVHPLGRTPSSLDPIRRAIHRQLEQQLGHGGARCEPTRAPTTEPVGADHDVTW